MKAAALLLGLACAVLVTRAAAATSPARKGVGAQKVIIKKASPVKKTVPAPVRARLPAAKTVQPATAPAPATPDASYDERELIKMPSPARLALRAEMRDRMVALDAVLQRLSEGKVEEAGQIAQLRLGVAVWWNHTQLPAVAQPEQYMPPAMQTLALDGYKAATDFATVALTGDRHTATAMLPQLTGSCTQCHQAYRIR
ncbi:MAG: cytochrome c [Azonexaceae bacterium]|nr:cytochrome c [Azonexaceae bacterium]